MTDAIPSLDVFRVAAGKIPGTDHTMPGQPAWKNCQDACRVEQSEHAIVIVVCDGNGSQPHSEVGATLSAQLLARDILDQIDLRTQAGITINIPEILEESRLSLMVLFRDLGDHLMGSFSDNANRYMLATALVAVVTKTETVIAGIGDGYYAVNDELVELGPFPGNAPPYPVYALTGSSLAEHSPELIRFTIHRSLPTSEVRTLAVMSDGVKYLIGAEGTPMPKKPHEQVPPLNVFWREDRFVNNPDNIRRQLALINIETISNTPDGRPHLRIGMLKDDTVIAVVQREPQPTATNEEA